MKRQFLAKVSFPVDLQLISCDPGANHKDPNSDSLNKKRKQKGENGKLREIPINRTAKK